MAWEDYNISWEQLKAIMDEARATRELERREPPVACPNDGEPLEQGPRGTLHCKFDGYIWSGGSGGVSRPSIVL